MPGGRHPFDGYLAAGGNGAARSINSSDPNLYLAGATRRYTVDEGRDGRHPLRWRQRYHSPGDTHPTDSMEGETVPQEIRLDV